MLIIFFLHFYAHFVCLILDVHCVSEWVGLLGQLGEIHHIHSHGHCGHRGWVQSSSYQSNDVPVGLLERPSLPLISAPSVRPGQGLTQVIEKAETSLGIPSPTELSAEVEEEEQKQRAEGESPPVSPHFLLLLAAREAFCLVPQVKSAVRRTHKRRTGRQHWEVQWECLLHSPAWSRTQWEQFLLLLSCDKAENCLSESLALSQLLPHKEDTRFF